jgi:hypothetical protein
MSDKKRKGSQTIASFLMNDYSLDLRAYVEEILQSLRLFKNIIGTEPKKLFPMSSFKFIMLPTNEAPGIAGPMDSFVAKAPRASRAPKRKADTQDVTLAEEFT